MKLSDHITVELLRYLQIGTSDIILPNFYVGVYEMDVMQLKKSGYIIEYEIKISRSDFFNDFKKNRFGSNKHEYMKSGKGYANRFCFVVPENMVSVQEVPDYAGLAYLCKNICGGRDYIKMIKPPPIIHKEKQFDTTSKLMTLAIKISSRELMWRSKLNLLKKKNK